MFTHGPGQYGYGIVIDSFNNYTRYGHGGDFAGFNVYTCRFIDDGVYIIILSNNQSNVKSIVTEIEHILFDTPEYIATQRSIYTKQSAAATNDQEKRRAIWQLNNLKASGKLSTKGMPKRI